MIIVFAADGKTPFSGKKQTAAQKAKSLQRAKVKKHTKKTTKKKNSPKKKAARDSEKISRLRSEIQGIREDMKKLVEKADGNRGKVALTSKYRRLQAKKKKTLSRLKRMMGR